MPHLAPPLPPPPPVAAGAERYVIPNLRNACRILKALGRHPGGLKSAELARSLRIPVTTTLRIMTTLCLEGLARKRADGRFELGPALIQLGHVALTGTEIRDLAQPLLVGLTAATDETSHLAIPCDDRSLIVAVQQSPHPLRAASQPGFLGELHCTSTGKVFLAYLHRARLAEVTAGATAHTPHTLTTPAALLAEVELTRSRGYSLDNEEFNLGVRCLAAPVFGSDGQLVAALGVTASTLRFPVARIVEVAAQVRVAADELSRHLGRA